MAGSGTRLGETTLIRKTDVDYSSRPAKMYLRAETAKTKIARSVLLTTEATVAIQMYLASRMDGDARVYPYTTDTAQYQLRKALVAAGLGEVDARTGRRLVHYHMLRKWFLTRFSAVSSRDVAELLAGHEGYLARSYFRPTEKRIRKEFLEAERKLSILKF